MFFMSFRHNSTVDIAYGDQKRRLGCGRVKEAIERRRSIKKYRPDPVPEEMISEILKTV
ncbi:MAG TPA: hypothetical protein DEF36_16475 [Desulfotomaculum sp.]|nr:hypothetical protein [Desulfotomaculum sp.]